MIGGRVGGGFGLPPRWGGEEVSRHGFAIMFESAYPIWLIGSGRAGQRRAPALDELFRGN